MPKIFALKKENILIINNIMMKMQENATYSIYSFFFRNTFNLNRMVEKRNLLDK